MTNKLLLLAVLLPALFAANAFAQSGNTPANAGLTPNTGDTTAARRDYPVIDYTQQKKYIVNEITFTGVNIIDVEGMAADIGIHRGDTILIPGPYISSAINKLLSRRQFSNVDIVAQPEGEFVNLEVILAADQIVKEWFFSGITKSQATDLKDKMKLKPGQKLNDYEINRHKNFIRDHFKEKGFRNTQVEVKIENDTTFMYSSYVNVTFMVNRNERVKIGSITFTGNEVFTDRRLRGVLKNTHQKGINIFQSAKFNEKKYEEDLENLIDFYNSKGYRNAFVVADSIFFISPSRLGIDITVSEGNQFYYRNIRWIGNTVYTTEQLNLILGIEQGDTYDRKALHKRLGIGKEGNPEEASVSSLYQNHGYLFSNIEPSEIVVGADSIDLEIRIFEGKQARINRVNISGNDMVDDEVIRRELYTVPGELYDRSMLMNTLRQLMSMKHFDQQSLQQPGIEPVTAELVDISFPLTEVASDQFEISGGFGAGQFIGSVGITLNNLSTRRFFNKNQWKPYPRGQNQSLSLRAQSNGSYYKAFSLSFTDPWLGGKKPVSLTVGSHYSSETDATGLLTGLFTKSDKRFRTFGISAGMGRRLSWPDPNFTLYNELSYTAYMLKNWDNFIVQEGLSNSNVIAVTTVFGRNTVYNPIFPTSGSSWSLSLSLTPPYSLFSKLDYSRSDITVNQRYRWIEYHKWKAKAEWYTPLSKSEMGGFVLMTKAEMGYLGHYNKNKLSPFEGFNMGGSGMTGYNVYGVDVIGLRGYEDGAITPQTSNNSFARVYNKFTLELRHPIIMQSGTQIYGLVFAEGGNAYRNWKEFNPFQLRRSLGVGVRINLPIVGMIGVDWGYGFDRPYGASKPSGSQITFTFGQQF